HPCGAADDAPIALYAQGRELFCVQKTIIAHHRPPSETIGSALASISYSSPLVERILKCPCAGRPRRRALVISRSSIDMTSPVSPKGESVRLHSEASICPDSSNEIPSSAPAASL